MRVVAVSPAFGAMCEILCSRLGLFFPCLGDPEGRAYDAYGLPRGRMSQLLNFHTIALGARALLRGHLPRAPSGDPYRLPGAFIIARGGTVRWAWRGRDAADHPGAAGLLTALDGLALDA